MKEQQVTLVIILHNRHANLERLLEFYENIMSPIIIADSSNHRHVFTKPMKSSVNYIYSPGVTYTQKIELVLESVLTPYVAMCADDDFVIPEGLYECVNFLDNNYDYCTAQGTIVKYYKNTIKGKLRMDLLYNGDYSLTSNDPIERLSKLFSPYKSLLYAVHRLDVLKFAFKNAGTAFSNLYLNEYLASVVPVVKGKCKDLSTLYQVREHADISDDKITPNIDIIATNDNYTTEYTGFINYIFEKMVEVDCGHGDLQKVLIKIFDQYILYLNSLKKMTPSFKKRVGHVVEMLPYMGKKYLSGRRYNESLQSLKRNLDSRDFLMLGKIESIIKKYKA